MGVILITMKRAPPSILRFVEAKMAADQIEVLHLTAAESGMDSKPSSQSTDNDEKLHAVDVESLTPVELAMIQDPRKMFIRPMDTLVGLISDQSQSEVPAVSPSLVVAKLTTVAELQMDTIQCYCLRERNLNMVELQCGSCFRWFHESCITFQIGKCVPFMTNYAFLCKTCNPTGLESFTKKQANFIQICQTSLANLIQQSIREGKPRIMFSKDKDIIPYIDNNWENLTTVSRRIKQTWHNTIVKTMIKETDLFVFEEKQQLPSLPSASSTEIEQSGDHPLFGLVVSDIIKIGPNYESYTKGGAYKSSDPQRANTPIVYGQMSQSLGGAFSGKGRNAKRRVPEMSFTSTKKTRSELAIPKLPSHGYPLEHPFNKDGYRYILAEPDVHAPFRQEFDESLDWAGKPIPGWLYRTLMPPAVFIALHDRAPQLKISDDRLTVTGDKGYCMVRATHGLSRGAWYFECTIEEMPDNSAVRLGWSQTLGNLQAPLGYDRFGYSYRSRKGTRFHESKGKHYGDGYAEGDTIGVLIDLPGHDARSATSMPVTFKDRPLVKFKSHLYYEDKDDLQLAVRHLRPHPGSRIVFYKNGKCQGVAWQDIYEGTYYPAISIYKNSQVSINFGAKFKYPPKDFVYRAMSESAFEAIVEQALADALFLVENDGKLRLENYVT